MCFLFFISSLFVSCLCLSSLLCNCNRRVRDWDLWLIGDLINLLLLVIFFFFLYMFTLSYHVAWKLWLVHDIEWTKWSMVVRLQFVDHQSFVNLLESARQDFEEIMLCFLAVSLIYKCLITCENKHRSRCALKLPSNGFVYHSLPIHRRLSLESWRENIYTANTWHIFSFHRKIMAGDKHWFC